MGYLFAIYFAITTFAVQSKEEYKEYCNSRFSFCINYPTEFSLMEESDSGDGASFKSVKNKAEISAYGRLSIEDLDKLEQEFKFATTNLKITYQVKKKSWFIFSGIDKEGKIVYQKTVKKAINFLGDENTDVFQTLRIAYPSDKKDVYGPYCKIISKSF